MTNQTLLAGLIAGQLAGNFHARAMQRMISITNDDKLNVVEREEAVTKEKENCIFNICQFSNDIAMGLCAMGNLAPTDPPSVAMLVDDGVGKVIVPT